MIDDGLLLRRYHDTDRLAHDPWYAPENEALALQLLANTAVPAQCLYAADLTPTICDVPALLESRLPGTPAWQPSDLGAYIAQAAEILVKIHAVSPPSDAKLPRYAPYYERHRIASPPFPTRPGLWERVAALDQPQPVPARRSSIATTTRGTSCGTDRG